MKDFVVTFLSPMSCTCRVKAKDMATALAAVHGKSWEELRGANYEPHVEDAKPQDLDRVEATEAEPALQVRAKAAWRPCSIHGEYRPDCGDCRSASLEAGISRNEVYSQENASGKHPE